MFTFLHDIAKPLAEISKMRLQRLWLTKQNDMASFAETLYKAPTKSERNLFFASVYFLIHSEQYANTCMTVLIRRVTCKRFFFFLGTTKSFKLRNLPSRTSTLFLSRWSACPFLNCDQVSNRFTEFSGKLTFYTLCSRKARYWKKIYVFINVS